MTIYFPDVSHYQSGLSLAGAVACVAKATEGASFIDPAYRGFLAQATDLGIPFVAYHWVDDSDITAQARHCYEVVGPDVPVMWDAEAAGSTVDRLVTLTDTYRSLGGRPRLVYLPHWWWQGHLGSPDLRPLTAAGLALIASEYTTYSDTGPGWAPYGGVTPVIWQYTDAHALNGMRVDFNAFRGTVQDLVALLDGADMPLSPDDLAAITNHVWHSDIDLGGRTISAGTALLSVPAAIKAALLDADVLAAIAKAVNDDAATRLGQ